MGEGVDPVRRDPVAEPAGESSAASARIPASGVTMAVVDPGDLGTANFPAAELLEAFVALVPDPAVVVDADGTIVSANEQTAAQFGYDLGELVGQPVEVLVPERFRHSHRGHRKEYAAEPRARAMGAGLRLYGRRRDGTEFPVDISLAPIAGGDSPLVVAAIRDISDRVAATAATARLAAIVQSSQDAMVSMSVEAEITSWNPGAERLFGYTEDEICGRHASVLIPSDQSHVFEELLGAAANAERIGARDTQQVRKDGTRIDVAVSMSAIREENGNLLGFSWFSRDITERKLAEARLRQLLVEEHKRERQQAATAEIRLALLSGAPVDGALTLICEHACELLDGHGASVVISESVGDPAGLTVTATAGEGVPTTGHGLAEPFAARVVARGESVRTTEVDGDRSTGSGPALGVPIAGGAASGALIVVRRSGAPLFSDDDVALAEALAGQAALALELSRAREDREALLLIQDRERIARDLHDLVIQRLFAAGLNLQGTMRLVDNKHAAGRIASSVRELDQTILDIRTSIFALETPAGSESGPRWEILRVVADAAGPLGFEPAVRFDGPVDVGMSVDVLPHALAVVREALSNAARHAHATQVVVEVSVRESITIVVSDNGIGLPEAHRSSGLSNMRQRAETLGGDFEVVSGSGGGTSVRWRVPLRD